MLGETRNGEVPAGTQLGEKRNCMKRTQITALLAALVLLASLSTGCGQEKAASSDTSGVQSAAAETKVEKNDFAPQCETYLTYLGTHLKDRSILPAGQTAKPSNAHAKTLRWLEAELKKAGYASSQIELQPFSASGDNGAKYAGTNLVLSIPGKTHDRLVIAGAHYDGDGCGDNGSGVALLLAGAVGLHGQTPRQDLKIVFFDGEEVGELGSAAFAASLSAAEVKHTQYMVNIDSVAFGDYCNLYGGDQDDASKTVKNTGAYRLALKKAAALGIQTLTTADLDGYYAQHKTGPKIEENTVYTNPWTYANPAPKNAECMSPTTGPWSDHVPFDDLGIPYVYLEAVNWYAAGTDESLAYTGYYETTDTSLGDGGMFMNTSYDTLKNLNKLFPGRALAHFHVFSPLLSSLLLNGESGARK